MMLLSSLCLFWTCALFQSGGGAQELGIALLDADQQYIKGANVELVDQDKRKHRAKYDANSNTYFFKEAFTSGTLRLTHRKYLTEEYDLQDLLDKKVGRSISLFLRTTRQSFYTHGGIRYPYEAQEGRIALLAKDEGPESEKQLKQNEIYLESLGVKIDLDFAKEYKDKYPQIIPEHRFLARVYNIKHLDENTQQKCLTYLKTQNDQFYFGPLIGYIYLLSNQFYVVIKEPKMRSEAIEKIKAEGFTIKQEKNEQGYFLLESSSFSDQQILDAIEKLNDSNLFVSIQPHLIEISEVEL